MIMNSTGVTGTCDAATIVAMQTSQDAAGLSQFAWRANVQAYSHPTTYTAAHVTQQRTPVRLSHATSAPYVA
jgi:hypothetical protein